MSIETKLEQIKLLEGVIAKLQKQIGSEAWQQEREKAKAFFGDNSPAGEYDLHTDKRCALKGIYGEELI